MTNIEARHENILLWLEECSEMIRHALEEGISVEAKAHRKDLVTNLDKGVERLLVNKIREHYPDDQIVGEEGYGDEVTDLEKNTWFIDPIDGTTNFVLQQENFAVMLAVYEKGQPVQAYIYDIEREELYYALKDAGVFCNDEKLPNISNIDLADGLYASSSFYHGNNDPRYAFHNDLVKESMGLRIYGSAGKEAIELIKGNTVAFIAHRPKPWDLAPGAFLVEEAGGKVVNINDESIDVLAEDSIIMGTPAACQQAYHIIQNYNQ